MKGRESLFAWLCVNEKTEHITVLLTTDYSRRGFTAYVTITEPDNVLPLGRVSQIVPVQC